MKTCKICGKEIDYTNKTKLCAVCEAMSPEERKKSRPERFAFILYISDIALILITAAIAIIPYITNN